MEVRGQENKTKMAGFSGYSNQSTGFSRSSTRDGNHNGTTVLTCTTQTLDHHVHYLQRQPSLGGSTKRSPNTDRVTLSNSNSKPGSIRYRECLKNHAATVGGSIYDGCGEFMPSGEEGTLEALKCAACECHRNFHRKEVDGETQRSLIVSPIQLPHHHHHPLPSPIQHHPPHQPYSSPSSAIVAPVNVAFGGGGGGGGGGSGAGTESSSEDLNLFHCNAEPGMPPPPPPFVLSKKRFRTKFSQEQKEKMLEFAEKLGWRMQKQDDDEVQRFCNEVGVKRQVFKVWMHNNKNNVKKQQQEPGQEQEQQQEQHEPLPL